MPISTSYVIFHAMALFTVFSVGNQGFEDRGNKDVGGPITLNGGVTLLNDKITKSGIISQCENLS